VELKRMKGKDWKKLYCVLYKDFIYFFEPHEKVSMNVSPYTLINLKFITSVDYGKEPFTFNISTPLRRFVIKCKHEVAVDQWIEHIENRRMKKSGQKEPSGKVKGKRNTDDKGYMYSKNIKGKMKLIDTTNKRRVYKFPKSSPLGGSIGRSSSNDLVISVDAYISRSHCRIEIRENVPFLLDLGTTTGTILNDKKVTQAPLKPGDIIRLGRTDFEFQVKEGNEIFSRKNISVSSDSEENETVKKKKKKKKITKKIDNNDEDLIFDEKNKSSESLEGGNKNNESTKNKNTKENKIIITRMHESTK